MNGMGRPEGRPTNPCAAAKQLPHRTATPSELVDHLDVAAALLDRAVAIGARLELGLDDDLGFEHVHTLRLAEMAGRHVAVARKVAELAGAAA